MILVIFNLYFPSVYIPTSSFCILDEICERSFQIVSENRQIKRVFLKF